MSEIHIPSFVPETIFSVGGIHVTNTVINTWIALVIFLVLGLFLRSRLSLRPSKLQHTCEYIVDTLCYYFDQVTGSREKTYRFLPIAGSIFFFILLSNWLGLFPGTGSVFVDHAPVLRPANTDLNLTLAMAFVSVLSSHLFAFGAIGVAAHLNKFFQIGTIVKSLRRGPTAIFTALVEAVVGLIEVVGEMAKVMSLSLRLFGNIFAGEVLISVISGLVAAVIPLPFMLLELLVGLIQATVFAMLTMVYLTIATAEPHGSDEGH